MIFNGLMYSQTRSQIVIKNKEKGTKSLVYKTVIGDSNEDDTGRLCFGASRLPTAFQDTWQRRSLMRFPPCVVRRHIRRLPPANLLHSGNGSALAYKIDSYPDPRGMSAEASLYTGRLTCRRDTVANTPGCHRKDAVRILHVHRADQIQRLDGCP